jgi:hypothetical protein
LRYGADAQPEQGLAYRHSTKAAQHEMPPR